MQTLTIALLATLLFSTPASAQTPLATALAEQLAGFPAKTGLYVKHLTTGEEVSIRADQSFNSQSVIKIPIMVRAFQLADAGRLNLDERLTLGRADLRDGTGIFQNLDLGSTPTLRDLIQQMIVTSDNTATDAVTVKVGGKEAVNADLAKAGYAMRFLNRGWEYRRKLLARLDPRLADITGEEVTGLQYAMADSPLFSHYATVFTGPRAAWLDVVRDPKNRLAHRANQRKLMVEDRDVWLGDITAREIGRMLESIERCTALPPTQTPRAADTPTARAAGTPAPASSSRSLAQGTPLASRASCDTMTLFLRRQLAGSRRLPHFLDVPVGHKTGDAGNIANDVGIIYARSGPIVIAALVSGITGSYGEAEDRIGRLAKTVVDHFDGAAPGATSAAPPATSAGQAATPATAPPTRRVIQPPGYKPTPSPLTPGIMVGDTLYLSGSTGGDPATGQLVAGGFEPEMRQIMANMRAVLTEAGMTLADVVSVTGYLADMADFARYNEIYREYFTTLPLPTRSTVAVRELARGARIELTMTAVRSK
jgi:2-iminobutanoate/2-iminopropanoate deaminase